MQYDANVYAELFLSSVVNNPVMFAWKEQTQATEKKLAKRIVVAKIKNNVVSKFLQEISCQGVRTRNWKCEFAPTFTYSGALLSYHCGVAKSIGLQAPHQSTNTNYLPLWGAL